MIADEARKSSERGQKQGVSEHGDILNEQRGNKEETKRKQRTRTTPTRREGRPCRSRGTRYQWRIGKWWILAIGISLWRNGRW